MSVKLQDIFDIDFLQKFQDDFSTAVGFSSITVDIDGNPVTQPSNFLNSVWNIQENHQKV